MGYHDNRTRKRSLLHASFSKLLLGVGFALISGLAQADVIFQETFDNGLGAFTASGSVTTGTFGARMAGTFGGTDGSITSRGISTVGFSNITLTYSRTLTGLDSGEAGVAAFSVDGTNFTTVESVQTGSGTVTFNLPATAANQSALRLRFRISASLSSETYDVDNVRLDGTAGSTTPPPTTTNPFQRGPDPTSASLQTNGPFTVATTTVSSPQGFGGGTIYFPTNTTEGPFALIAVAPGFTERQSAINWWGPRLASHGFVVVTIDTNSTSDQPASRATQLIAALNQVASLSTNSSSPIFGKVDGNRRGVMGHSMGGGGTLIAAQNNPSLKAAIPFAPWNSASTNFSGIVVPTMIIACQNDSVAPVDQHAFPFYQSIPNSTKKTFAEVAGGSHSCANSGNSNTATLGKSGISWAKRFMDNDTRYTQFLCGTQSTVYSRYLQNCPY